MQSRDERLGRPRLSGTRQVAASHRAPRTSQVPTSKTVGEEMAIAVESEVEQRIAIAPGEPDVPRLRSGRVDDRDADLGDNVPVGREAENRALGIGGECRSRLAGLAEQGDGSPSGGSTQARMILVRRADRRARDGGWR